MLTAGFVQFFVSKSDIRRTKLPVWKFACAITAAPTLNSVCLQLRWLARGYSTRQPKLKTGAAAFAKIEK